MTWRLHIGDCMDVLPTLPEASAHCVVTSPPYWGLRDYGLAPRDWPEVTFVPVAGLPSVTIPAQSACLGLEADPWAYVAHMVAVFREVRRVLRVDGTLWLNLGDCYCGNAPGNARPDHRGRKLCVTRGLQGGSRASRVAGLRRDFAGLKHKDMAGLPWRVAQALQADGWYLRLDNVWNKTNTTPECVTDRPFKVHEYVFQFSRSERYYYDQEAIREAVTGNAHSRGSGVNPKAAANAIGSRQNASFSAAVKDLVAVRNRRSVWTIAVEPYKGAHFATMPTALAEVCILAGCPVGGGVLDPFAGAGTTLYTAEKLGRDSIGIEANPQNETLIRARMTAGRRAAPPITPAITGGTLL